LTGHESDGFVQVWFRGGTGWIYKGYTAGYTGRGAQAIAAVGLHVRTGPSTANTIVGYAYSGQMYSSGSTSSDGAWTQIRYDENLRWVYLAYTRPVALKP